MKEMTREEARRKRTWAQAAFGMGLLLGPFAGALAGHWVFSYQVQNHPENFREAGIFIPVMMGAAWILGAIVGTVILPVVLWIIVRVGCYFRNRSSDPVPK